MGAKLLKKNNDILLTLKAYNGRCALEWLAERLRDAVQVPEHTAADQSLELQSVALNLVIYHPHWHPFLPQLGIPQLRTSMARVLGQMERAPRFLCLICT